MKYTRKSETIEAIQYTSANLEEAMKFINGNGIPTAGVIVGVPTPEGTSTICEKDFIIKSGEGKFLIVKARVFNQTYEPSKDCELETLKESAQLLYELHSLKKHKDYYGKDSHYVQNQPDLWKKVKEFFESHPVYEGEELEARV